MALTSTIVQNLTDEFNKTYWKAAQTSKPEDWFNTALLGRQLIVELGRAGLVHDKLMDPEYTNKFTLEKKNA